MSDDKTIHYCFNVSGAGGGLRTYFEALLHCRPANVSERVLTSLQNVDQSQFKLLHIQDRDLLANLQGECSSVYTVHGHSPYCPSGTKHLRLQQTCCDRPRSIVGCTWGHLVDGCGSRRPQKIIHNLQKSYQELEVLKKHRTTVIANSDYVRGQLIRHGLPPEQVITLRCGILMPENATELLAFETHQNHRLLFVGRIVPEKGFDWLLKALAQADSRIHLDIAGDGWDQPRMEQLANKLGVAKRLTWHGWRNPKQLDVLYQQCFAVIFPSVWPEPAGLITLEAYAHYRPVIASSVGGIPEHVRDRQTGILVPANDIKQLAAAITELATDYQTSRRMGEQGHAWLLKEFTMDTHIKRLQNIYEKAIVDFHAHR